MPTTKEHNDEVMRKLTEREKVANFAVRILKLEPMQAEVFGKACADRFEWDGVSLMFKGANGKVMADDEQCTGFFRREYSFLFSGQPGGEGHAEIDPVLLDSAKAGNMTARARIVRDYLGGDVKRLDSVLADKGNGDGDGAPNGGGTGNGFDGTHASNPFTKLRDHNGKIVPAVEKQIQQMIRVMGTKKVAAIAAAVNMTITGLPLGRH